MNATSPHPILERPWRTYAKAIVFILPAVITWGFACVFLVPKAREISHMAGLNPTELGWAWPPTFFLVEWGRAVLVTGVVALALLEFAVPNWWRGRRLAVGISTWLTNVAVLFGLSVLLVLVLVAAPHLASTH